MKITHDTNGNKVLKVESHDIQGKRGFSVQTLGNLPHTHREGITKATLCELKLFLAEHGTKKQKEKIDCRLTRTDYMNGSFLLKSVGLNVHHIYYSQFVTESTFHFVKSNIGVKKLLASTDEHLNDVAKHSNGGRGGWIWDCSPINLNLARELGEVSQGYSPSPAFYTCVGKACAKTIIEQMKGA